MRLKNELFFAAFAVLMMLTFCLFTPKLSKCSEDAGLKFEVLGSGEISGYVEETYFVVRTQAEWGKIWEKFTAPYSPKPSRPEIFFSENMVICAFMGEQPSTGYGISVERIWVGEEKEKVHIEIAKTSPSPKAVVCKVLTHPYVFVSLEKIDKEAVFHTSEAGGTTVNHTLPEFPTIVHALAILVGSSFALVAFKHKTVKNWLGY